MITDDNKPIFQVQQFIDIDQMRRDMAYSPADMGSAMMDQAALFAHYGALLSRASSQVEKAKMVLETAMAKVAKRIRSDAAIKGDKLTEPQLAAEVALHKSVIAMKIAVSEAKEIEQLAKTAVEGMRHKRDMLIQASVTSREEMKGELSLTMKRINDETNEQTKQRLLERRRQRQEEGAEN